MANEVVISEDIANQVAEILRQDSDPSVNALADILDPPPTPPVPTIKETIENFIINNNDSANTAQSIIDYVSNRILEFSEFNLSTPNIPLSLTTIISDFIKNS